MTIHLFLRLCGVLGLCASIGCGASTTPPVPTAGVVKTKGGRPCAKALVVFHPADKGRINDPKPVATTNADGRFQLTTFAENDGASPGNYSVTVVWPGAAGNGAELSLSGEGQAVGADQLNGSYGDPAHPLLKATIAKQTGAEITLEVDENLTNSVVAVPQD